MNDIFSDKIKQKKNEIFQERRDFQNEKESWEKLFSEQKKRLEEAIELLKQYNQEDEKQAIKSKEEEKKLQIQQNYKYKDIKSKIENLKNLYDIKLKNFTDKKKIFEEEKTKFENYKTEINNNIQIKKIEIEQKNLELLKKNSEIKQRYNNIKNKEMYLKDKYEDYLRIKNIVESKEKINIQYEKDLKLAAERILKYTDEINNKENYIQKEKAELLKKSNAVKEHQKRIEDTKLDIEHEKVELNLRYQNLNSFTYQSPNMMFINNYNYVNDDNKMNLDDNNTNLEDYNDISYKNNNYDKNIIDNGGYKNFNANKYINAVKDRIENGKRINFNNYKMNENKFDIANERLYLQKCNTNFNKTNNNI